MRNRDQDLIGGFLEGEEQATREILDWIRVSCAAFRRRLIMDWEDVQQQVNVELIRLFRAKRFQGRSSLRTYVWRVASNRCIDLVRKQDRWKVEELSETVDLPAADPTPLQQVLRSEETALRLEVLNGMPEACRRLWRMIGAGRSYLEMSQVVGVTQGALRVRISRCRKQAWSHLEAKLSQVQGD